eukprot:gene1410-1606_t
MDLPCEFATIDVIDVLGTRNDNVTKNVNKWQIDSKGRLEPVWEAFAERVEQLQLPVSVIQVDCVANRDLCLNQHIQAFPALRFFKDKDAQPPDYRSDRTVDALVEFVRQRVALDEQLAQMEPDAKLAHDIKKELLKDDHPGCLLSGYLLVNRVPGNFHIEARSRHHNLNPVTANVSHVVNHLSFGPVLTTAMSEKVVEVPSQFFDPKATHPMDSNVYVNNKLHQAYHHYIKVVSTSMELGRKYQGRNSILAYQLVQSSQIMQYFEEDVPEARFTYDISPMAVVISRKGKKWYEFVTSICALIGGTFTVVGLVSGFLSVIFKAKKI